MYLPGQGSFWGFSDTFLNQNGGRTGSTVVGNTIAIGQIINGNFTPTYFHGGTAANPTGFFPNPSGYARFWIQKAVYVNSKLFVFLSIRYAPPGGSTNGVYSGEFIARVNNPSAIPWDWDVDYFSLIFTTQAGTPCTLQPGVEAIPTGDGNYVLVYGFFNASDGSDNKSIALLVTIDSLMNTPAGGSVSPSSVQYLANYEGTPQWKAGFGGIADTGDTDDYYNTYLGSVSGMSLRYNATLGMWQAVGINGISSNTATPAYSACAWYSTSGTGPFVRSNIITNFPSTANDSTLYCYAVREWLTDPSAPNDSEILFTYTYSSTNLQEIYSNANLYQTYSQVVSNPGPSQGVPASHSMMSRSKYAPFADAGSRKASPDPLSGPGTPKPLTSPLSSRRPTFPPGATTGNVDVLKKLLSKPQR